MAQLNESQREAVEYMEGAELVIAGAGSGKTRVLTYKVAFLLCNGYKPWNILALTFTNKAAREMKERVGRIVGVDQARQLNMGTFHSVFSRILRVEAQAIGYEHNFTIYDQSDSRQLVKNIIKEMGLDEKVYKPAVVADRISMAKNRLLLPQAYANSAPTVMYDAERRMPAIKDIYIKYSERCRQANAMDFDDLIVNTYTLFNNNEEIRRKYVNRFLYVLVDEYQDTNFAQQAVVMQLTKERQRVCVVGDDAQSIYSFRGANIDNILNFSDTYDGARLFKLEQNYRSTQLIVQAANSLIKHNARQIPKNVYSRNEEGDKLQLKPAYSDKEEALIVCQDIKRIKKQDGCAFSDFAILYRTNSQSRSFEEYMRKEGIPYRIYGGLSFYQRKEIKDVIAYFRLVANPSDEEALRRIINYPTRGIGATTLNKIVDTAVAGGTSLWNVVSDPQRYGLGASKGTLAKLAAFKTMVQAWIERVQTDDAYALGTDIIKDSGVSRDIYGGSAPEDISRQENLEELIGGMQDFVESRREEGQENAVSLVDFLQEVSLMTDFDSDDDSDSPKVTLMTIHSAKGLEFQTVFIVGLEENIFPSPMSCNSARELEEERRLLYVAITRAMRHCILTCAQNRFRYGRMEYDTPSRFIRDIDQSLVHVASAGGGLLDEARPRRWGAPSLGGGSEWMQNPRPVATQFRADPKPRIVAPRTEGQPVNPFSESFSRRLNAAGVSTPRANAAVPPVNGCPLAVGDKVEHMRFGRGTVQGIEGTGENMKATVNFENTGTKQLLLKFARLKVIG